MKKYIITFTVLLLVVNFLIAMNEGTTGAQFLKILVGGKATSLGGAFVALADDASALYYNPAGIVKLNKNNIMFNYVKWPADIGFSFIGAVFPMGVQGTFGISASLLSVPSMEVTTVEYPDGTGEYFTVSSYQVGFSYAKYFTDKLTVGITTKIIQEIIYDATSSMIAIDVGATYMTGFKSLRIGMAVRNFGSEGQFSGGTVLTEKIDFFEEGNNTPVNFMYITEPYAIPLNFNFGVAYDFLEGPDNFLTGILEFQNPNDGTEKVRIGLEYNFAKMLAFRLGYKIDYEKIKNKIDTKEIGTWTLEEKIEDASAGIGFNVNVSGFDIGIDYSFTGLGLLGDAFTNGHRVSLCVGF